MIVVVTPKKNSFSADVSQTVIKHSNYEYLKVRKCIGF